MELTPDFEKVLPCYSLLDQAEASIRLYEIEDQAYDRLLTLCKEFHIEEHINNLGYFFNSLCHPDIATKLSGALMNEYSQEAEAFNLESFVNQTLIKFKVKPPKFFEKIDGNYPLTIEYRGVQVEIKDQNTIFSVLKYLEKLKDSHSRLGKGYDQTQIAKVLQSTRVPSNIVRDTIALRTYRYLVNQKLLKNISKRRYFVGRLLQLGGHTLTSPTTDDPISEKNNLIGSVKSIIDREEKRTYSKSQTNTPKKSDT